MIKQYLSNIINDHKTQGERKIQLIMEINFISSKVSTEYRTMHTTVVYNGPFWDTQS